MPNTTDTQLATLGAMAQLAMDMHTDGDTRDTIIENLTTIHMRDPEGAAQLLSVAIWLIAQNMCADDVEADGGAEAEPAPAADPEFGRYGIRTRQAHDGTRILVTCGDRLVAEYPGRVQVAVIVDKILEDMGGGDAAEPEPDDQPEPLRGTISEVTFDRETFELMSAKAGGMPVGDMSPFVAAGHMHLPLLKVAISPDGTLAIRVTSIMITASAEQRAQIGQRIRVAAERLLEERPELQGQRLFLLWNSASGKFESVDVLDSGIPAPSSPGWAGVESVGAEMTALSDLLETAEEALKTPPDELAARLDQIRTGEIRFPKSWKSGDAGPKVGRSGAEDVPEIMNADTQAAPRASTAPEPRIADFRTDADIRDEEGMKGE